MDSLAGTHLGLAHLLVPEDALGFWTAVLAIATIGLVVVAFYGLKSLRLAKADIKARMTREARACAITRCQEFGNDILDEHMKVVTLVSQGTVPKFPVKAVNWEAIDKVEEQKAIAWRNGLTGADHSVVVAVANRLEAWAMYFTTGVADHELAFGPCAPLYCSMLLQYYPLILASAASGSGAFPNAKKLYTDWFNLLEQKRSGMKVEELTKQLRRIQEEAAKRGGSSLPKVIGTDID
jgi:hypothetical protein